MTSLSLDIPFEQKIKIKCFLQNPIFDMIFMSICYPLSIFIIVADISDEMLLGWLNISDHQMEVIVWCAISLYVVKIAWFCYSRFFLETKERLHQLKKHSNK